MMFDFSPLLVVPVIVFVYLFSCIHVLKEYERAVVFRLGKLLTAAKGPGLIFIFRPIDTIVKVSLRTAVHDVPPQDIITRDNVSVKVNAVVYYRVIDPRRAIVEVENYTYATSQLAQTTLRSILGQADLDGLLSERDGAPGRGGAREARQDHSRRRRADRVREAVAGRRDHRPRGRRDDAALPA